MFSSDINKLNEMLRHSGRIYFVISAICLLFGIIYEYFSHGVYSAYMMFAFCIPLAGGTLTAFLLSLFERKKPFSKISVCAYHSGIATLTVGSIFKGVLEIYGTTNQLIVVYWIAGFGLLFIGILTYLLPKKRGYSKIAD